VALIRLIATPIQRVVRFPLFQLAVVAIIILFLQAADDASIPGYLFHGLDRLVAATMALVGTVAEVKTFTQSALIIVFMIGYVYLACLLIFYLLRYVTRSLIDRAARANAWLRNSLARERGIAAYRAWEPLESIRPPEVPQEKWEETYAWPANNKPPYPPLARRVLWSIASYVVVVLVFAALLQYFTPLPALNWLFAGLGGLARLATGGS
jgi:hypothetical protein